VKLTTQDLRVQPGPDEERGSIAWDQRHVIAGAESDGAWYVEVAAPGTYRFEVRRWPTESELALCDRPPGHDDAMQLESDTAVLEIAGTRHTRAADPDAEGVTFEVELDVGTTDLWAGFVRQGAAPLTAYYVYVSRLDGRGDPA
jgi:hypothetical protein